MVSNEEYVPLIKNGRVVGNVIPMSIGTALAMESLLDNLDKLESYNAIYINLKTVLRNTIGAFETPVGKFDTGKVIDGFCDDINTLLAVQQSGLPTHMKMVLYVPSYKSVKTIFKYAQVKEPKTPKQMDLFNLEKICIDKICNLFKGLTIVDCKLESNYETAIILTHFPVDLLSAKQFRKLTLVESHTGELKEKPKWITKLSNKQEYANIPFNQLTLQVFGDGKMFGSLGAKSNTTLLQLAEQCNWTALTTVDKVRHDIDKLNDKFSVAVFKGMFASTIK